MFGFLVIFVNAFYEERAKIEVEAVVKAVDNEGDRFGRFFALSEDIAKWERVDIFAVSDNKHKNNLQKRRIRRFRRASSIKLQKGGKIRLECKTREKSLQKINNLMFLKRSFQRYPIEVSDFLLSEENLPSRKAE